MATPNLVPPGDITAGLSPDGEFRSRYWDENGKLLDAAEPPDDDDLFWIGQQAFRYLYLQYRRDEGLPLTSDEADELDRFRSRLEAVEARRSRLGLVELAEVMEEGFTEPELLTELLVKGELHYVYGMKESAKTWLLLIHATRVIRQGGVVVWVDKEMGRKNLADRLGSLGLPSELVRASFVYCEYPTLDTSVESVTTWTALLGARKPSLLVIDAQTEVLADAGLNENVGTDIERWQKAYITPARRLGCTVAMLDHTGHDEQGRAVGSRHKGAAAKVEWAVRCVKKFDRDTAGEIEVTRNKNTVSAAIPEAVRYAIGGDGQGGFLFTEVAAPVTDATASASFLRARQDAWKMILENPDGLTQTQVRGMVSGGNALIGKVLASLVSDASSGVKARPGKREGSLLYYPVQTDLPSPSRSLDRETGRDGKSR